MCDVLDCGSSIFFPWFFLFLVMTCTEYYYFREIAYSFISAYLNIQCDYWLQALQLFLSLATPC